MTLISETESFTGSQASVREYIALLKPRVMSLVVFSGLCGLLLAPEPVHIAVIVSFVISLAIGAGAAGAINMWYDRDIDAIMSRTQGRSLPKGKIPAAEALHFGIILSVLAVVTMAITVNLMAAALLAFANFFYAVVYTIWLKRHTAQNIVIGGAAGAFPPMIGWAAATGTVSIESFCLFLIIFLWTPPHFWALSLYAHDDYKKANVPMMPITHGIRHTKLNILFYTAALVASTFLPYGLGVAGVGYAIAAALLGGLFMLSAVLVWKESDERFKRARQMFAYSIFYLFALFTAMVLWG